MTSAFSCVNCRLGFQQETQYKLHYKSEHHRYNVKRRLIGLMPLSFQEYTVQFQTQLSSKSSTQKQLHCELCSKKFLSPQTYKQHLNSQKHKNNRKKLVQQSSNASHCDERSQTSSCSEFSVIGTEKPKKHECLFCSASYSKEHLKDVHNFPPFADQCTNFDELIKFVKEEIQSGHCLICEQTFQCQESAKQHMFEVGHARLNTNDFSKYEKFYLWKIEESSEEETQFQHLNNDQDINQEGHEFEHLKKETLQSLERKRLQRIQPTSIGFMINGKQVGTRDFKQYYKQYLGRQIPKNPFREQKALTNSEDWKQNIVKRPLLPCRYQKVTGINHR